MKKKKNEVFLISSFGLLLVLAGILIGIGATGIAVKDTAVSLDINAKNRELERKLNGNGILEIEKKALSLEKEIVFAKGDALGEARIANGIENRLLVTLTIYHDANGEVLYATKIIEPGFYIENISLNKVLEKGAYPCTGVWTFYTPEEDLLGEMAQKIVVIIKN
ncbi:MAG: hypothetical protein ACRCU3_10515 [Eubacteriaceae bacterium]